MKIELWDWCFTSASGLQLAGIHLRQRTNESELLHRPPFCRPDLQQANRIVPLTVVVIDPMFRATVPAEWLGIIEQLPVAIELLPGLVLLAFVERAMSRHDFQDILTVR